MTKHGDTPRTNTAAESSGLEVLTVGGGAVSGLKAGALAGMTVLGPLGAIPGALIGMGAGSLAGAVVLGWLRSA